MFFGSGEPRPEHFRIAERPMRFADDERTVLRINEHIALAGIPVATIRRAVHISVETVRIVAALPDPLADG